MLRVGMASPNPFAARTGVHYTLDESSSVLVGVYDVSGRRVLRRSVGKQGQGMHRFEWDGHTDVGREVAPGTYFVRVRAGGTTVTRKAVLLP